MFNIVVIENEIYDLLSIILVFTSIVPEEFEIIGYLVHPFSEKPFSDETLKEMIYNDDDEPMINFDLDQRQKIKELYRKGNIRYKPDVCDLLGELDFPNSFLFIDCHLGREKESEIFYRGIFFADKLISQNDEFYFVFITKYKDDSVKKIVFDDLMYKERLNNSKKIINKCIGFVSKDDFMTRQTSCINKVREYIDEFINEKQGLIFILSKLLSPMKYGGTDESLNIITHSSVEKKSIEYWRTKLDNAKKAINKIKKLLAQKTIEYIENYFLVMTKNLEKRSKAEMCGHPLEKDQYISFKEYFRSDDKRLYQKIENVSKNCENGNMIIKREIKGLEKINIYAEISIIVEGIGNIINCSATNAKNASNIFIRIQNREEENCFIVNISDDGDGFSKPMKEVFSKKGTGNKLFEAKELLRFYVTWKIETINNGKYYKYDVYRNRDDYEKDKNEIPEEFDASLGFVEEKVKKGTIHELIFRYPGEI